MDIVSDRKGMLVRAINPGLELPDKRPTKRNRPDFECRYCARPFPPYQQNLFEIHEENHLKTQNPGLANGLPDEWIQKIIDT